ncbi:unnamed protein product [Adineta ricciae]|uniref:4'-phosphopantetheinyl transferase N-terminal domain-containing protein n=1 Tax=Adineta ricciae TaxID=249248 RepID=A0A814C978_ADIRI|nr:unnamed protein product [Adineta ricciae]
MYRFYFNCHHWKPTRDQWVYANRCLPSREIQRIDEYAYERDRKSNHLFDFNLSHHNQLVSIAGTFAGQIGCDTILYQIYIRRIRTHRKKSEEFLSSMVIERKLREMVREKIFLETRLFQIQFYELISNYRQIKYVSMNK